MTAESTRFNLNPLKRPLFAPAAAFALGILAADRAAPAPALAVIFGAVLLLLARGRKPQLLSVCLIICTFFVAMACYTLYTLLDPLDVSHFIGSPVTAVVGTVADDPEVTGERTRLRIRITRVETNSKAYDACGNLMCTAYGWEREDLPEYGERVVLRGRLTVPPEPTNPGVFSYRTYLARQRIYATMYLRRPGQMQILTPGRRNPAMFLATLARHRVTESTQALMPPREAAVSTGMTLGTYATLPDEVFTAFQRTGTLHLLAASGFNCAIIFVSSVWLLRLLRIPRRTAYIGAIPILTFYMLMVGFKPSIVRATMMALLVAGSYILGRACDPLNILFAAALLILAFRPTDLFDVGFQLSFAAVLGIIFTLPIAQRFADRLFSFHTHRVGFRVGQWLGKNLIEAVLVTIAATLGTLPITAHYFNQFSLVSVLANAAVALMASLVFQFGLATPALDLIPGIGPVVAMAGAYLIKGLLGTVDYLAAPVWSCITVPSPGLIGSAGYYIAVGTILAYLSGKRHEKL